MFLVNDMFYDRFGYGLPFLGFSPHNSVDSFLQFLCFPYENLVLLSQGRQTMGPKLMKV